MKTKMTDTGQVFRVTFEPKTKGEVTFLLEMEMADGFQKMQEGLFTVKSERAAR
jgi:plastocyanin domain-containing protein